MKYQLIAMDIDGTLLNNQGEITQETKKALTAAANMGCYITLSTGRSLAAVQSFLPQIPLNAPLILYNGAMVADANGQILFHHTLGKKETDAILSSPYAPKSIILWNNHVLFLSGHTKETFDYERSAGVSGQLFPSADAFSCSTKILWIDEPSSLNKRKTALSGSLPNTISYCNSKPSYLEFFSSTVSKGTALHFLCNYLNVPPEKTIAFGDGENDIPLLQAAGLSIAMGNAAWETKAVSDYVTASNDENGIASALAHFF